MRLSARVWIAIVGVCIMLSACGGGGGGGGDGGDAGNGASGFDVAAANDLTGAPRSRPATMGALEAN